jgi:beta-lactamase class A
MRRSLTALVCCASLCWAFTPHAGAAAQATAQTEAAPLPAELHARVARQLAHVAAEFDGVMGISARDLTSGDRFEVNADTVFPQGSSIKIAILIELLRQAQAGTVKLDERVEFKRSMAAAGSGVLQHFGDASSALSLHDLAVLMIVLSDNSATNMLIGRAGMDNVNHNLERLGLTHTRLQRRMLDIDTERSGRENLSSPREMTQLLALIYQGKTLDAEHTAAALEILRYPKDTPLQRGLPAGVALANKPGSLDGVRCDSGIVMLAGHPYAIAVMTTFGRDADAAERAIAEVSREVFDYFQRIARSNALGVRVP